MHRGFRNTLRLVTLPPPGMASEKQRVPAENTLPSKFGYSAAVATMAGFPCAKRGEFWVMNTKDETEDRLLNELTLCECKVWDALVSGDRQADAAALDDGFLGVYPDGFAGKHDHVQQLADGPTIKSYELSAHRVLLLGNDHAVLSYRADFVRQKRRDTEAMYVSSIWRRSDEGWIGVFSQDTPAVN